MRYVIIISLLILSAISCTKIGKNVTVKGVVKNPITDETYEGLKVQLLVGETFALPGGFKEIKSTETDQNGKFELSAGRTKEVYVQVYDADGNYRLGWYEDGEYKGTSVKKVTKGKTMEVEYHLVPYGYIKVNIHNINCEGASDTLILERNYQEKQVGFFQPTTLTGCYTQEGIPAEVPMGNYEIKWTVKRGGGSETYSENLFIPENDVGEITINY